MEPCLFLCPSSSSSPKCPSLSLPSCPQHSSEEHRQDPGIHILRCEREENSRQQHRRGIKAEKGKEKAKKRWR